MDKVKVFCDECHSIYKESVGVKSKCPVCDCNRINPLYKKQSHEQVKVTRFTPNVEKMQLVGDAIRRQFPHLNEKQVAVKLGVLPRSALTHEELLELEQK